MRIYDIAMPVLQLIANGEVAMMALFSAYIDDYLAYEIFCYELPIELFSILKNDVRESEDLRDALLDSNILEQGVCNFIWRSLEDFDMWFHFLDGTSKILKDPRLTKRLPDDDLYIASGLFARFKEGTLDRDNWDAVYRQLVAESN